MKQSDLEISAIPLLLTSNLNIPQLHGELISRTPLIDKLALALRSPLTLLSAPAGFGKTTLLSQWIATSREEKQQVRFAWVTLEAEVDLGQFWRYVVTALERLHGGIGQSVAGMLETAQPPVSSILRILLNEIASLTEEFVLILDDYHHVEDPSIHATLTFFINNLAPNLHLVIASRSQPPLSLARWRAGNQLYELREADLRFTPAEASAFLNEMKRLNLSDDEINALAMRTEGWIAGLQLVALSLSGFNDASRHQVVSDFTGSQRYIVDYLIEEVLQKQPEAVRTFLLYTSVLNRLTASLCNAVTEQHDGQAMLEYLERANMFIIPLDQERRWYRYHQLFRDVLRNRLQHTQQQIVLELHRRATAWFGQNGEADEAIRHACAAREWLRAVELMAPRISTAWNHGEIRKIISWLGRLPDEHLESRPQLFLYYARALVLGGKTEAAAQRLADAEATLRERTRAQAAAEDLAMLGAICAFRTTVAAVSGETARALSLGQEALSLLPAEDKDIRAHATNSSGVAHFYRGDMVNAERACVEAGELAQEVGNLYLATVATSYQAQALVVQGRLTEAGKMLEQALDLSSSDKEPGLPRIPAASAACAVFGNLLYEWNRLEEAERHLTEAIELGQQLAFGSALWVAYHTLLHLRLALGDRTGALALMDQAQQYRYTSSIPLPARLMDADYARSCLALGLLEDAEHWARSRQSQQTETPSLIEEIEHITLARLRLRQDQPERALMVLERMRANAESHNRRRHLIAILALTALAQQALGAPQPAADALQQALFLAEPEGYVRTFVDEGRPMASLLYQILAQETQNHYVSSLLASFAVDEDHIGRPAGEDTPRHPDAGSDRYIESLTQRELEVLQLLAGGASNQDIAAELTIATTTAKKHVSNIIQKLAVNNRTQAVAKGRSLGLCN